MADIAVRFENVWKKFRRGERHDSLRDLIPSAAARLLRRQRDGLQAEEFWALKGVSFEVKAGEALGIIGPNGAGKSTTLKLLTKILKPTQGRSEVRGRVGALIEVAAGFHPDLTGRENIFLQGAVMGMAKAEISRRFDEIVDFAGAGEFVDTPVKRYSSGMQARLGFSVAAHLNPSVLLIDEVLSVGDIAFQQKCIERMESFKALGVAIVFVSHNLQAVASLCDTALCLRHEVQAYGPSHDVLAEYVRSTAQHSASTGDDVEILSTELADAAGQPVTAVTPGTRLRLRVTYRATKPITDLTLGFLVHRSTDRLRVYDGNIRSSELGLGVLAPGDHVVVDFAFRAHLTRGQYDLECHVFHNPTHRFLARVCPAGILVVEEERTVAGVADLEIEPKVVSRTAQPNTSPSALSPHQAGAALAPALHPQFRT